MIYLNNKLGKIFIIFFILVFIDQLLKYLIRSQGGFYICNPGIAWGIPVNGWVFFLFWSVLILALLFFLFKQCQIINFQFSIFPFVIRTRQYDGRQIPNIFPIFILAGAISNIVDRLKFGCVIDFIDLKFWPVFNSADVFIFLGILIFLAKWKKM